MAGLNFEAIGRCKVLKEKLRELDIQRNKFINELRAEVSRLAKGSSYLTPPEITVFDIELMHGLLSNISSADSELMQVVNEFNNWCQEAGEKPVKLHIPMRT
ncbi:hypothetical protein PSI22_19525 [Xenorhabdus sp. XENO-7]|uniref:Uncharacterized protein n=1 Tax=Xenorhabdus aichiensis TaxID=3025874 RepID=A0ABT5M7T4_9GAMM|nr:hypothetical protein [Xenorhabdus aichiensis]MDC9623763.1 hypothetical protein [Xenorhabdus aichiensis]